MAVFDLQHTESVDLHACDVLGDRESLHVNHVAISVGPQTDVRRGSAARAAHMMPPLSETEPVRTHVVGRMAMSDADRRDILDWIANQTRALAKTPPALQYRLLGGDAVDSMTQKERRRRFSCATFVQCCFREGIGVELVDEAALPPTPETTLRRVWGRDEQIRLARATGLRGEGPWPILLPAHLLHALDRDDPRATPYVPREDDWDFPRPASP